MTNENHDPSTTEHASQRKTPDSSSHDGGGLLPSRRRILQAIGGVGASLAVSGTALAGGHEDEEDGDRMGGRDESAVSGEAYSRYSDQVTDGTYTVIDEINITTEEGGFASIHIARPEEGVADVGFINPENGEPQNAAATIIGYSEWLEPGLHENVEVPLFQDEELDAVSELDRLEEPTVLVSLAHVDSNENCQWDFYDEGDEDPADNGAAENTENQFAPPSARPTSRRSSRSRRTPTSSRSRASGSFDSSFRTVFWSRSVRAPRVDGIRRVSTVLPATWSVSSSGDRTRS